MLKQVVIIGLIITSLVFSTTLINAYTINGIDIDLLFKFLKEVYHVDTSQYEVSFDNSRNEIKLTSSDGSSIIYVEFFEIRQGKVFLSSFSVAKGNLITSDKSLLNIKNLRDLGAAAAKVIRRYENFIGHRESFYEKMAIAVSSLEGSFKLPKSDRKSEKMTFVFSDIYLDVEIYKYYLSISAGRIVNNGKTPYIFVLDFPPPSFLPVNGGPEAYFDLGDKSSTIHYVEVKNPFPKDEAISYARHVMHAYYKGLGVSENDVEGSIDHIYAEIEFLQVNATTAIPVWHIVFYFSHSIKGAYGFSVTLDAKDGSLIGSQPLKAFSSDNSGRFGIYLLLLIVLAIPTGFFAVKKFLL